jgi:type I restriction enzyme S subunit
LEPTFGTSFDLLATAPRGVAKLRELILSLAVRGRLVRQFAAEQSAGEVLAEHKVLNRSSYPVTKVKRSAFDANEPSNLPSGWSPACVGEIVDVLDSVRRPVTKIDRKPGPYPYYGASGVVDYVSDYIFDEPLVLAGEDGAKWGPGDNTAFLIAGKTWVNNHAHVMRPIRSLVLDEFLVHAFNAMDVGPFITGMTVPKLNQAKLCSIVVALPPLAEQARIVARVEELMQLCDALEAHGRLQDEQHARLVATLFDALAASASAEELAENWQRIATHFDLLLDRPEAVDALEQTLLQLAVRGLLAPQEPTDEPASKLLRRICIEKDHLIAEGKIKRAKSLPPISDEEKSFELPTGWEWVRAGSVGVTQTGGTPASNKPEYFNGNFPFIGPGQITPSGEILPPEKFISELGRSESAVAEPGDILMVCIGGSIGKCAAVSFPTAFNQQINSIRPLLASSEFILTAMTTSDFVSKVVSTATGSATPIISKGKWDLLLLPLPPLAEQHRIVARVEQLRRLCTELRERLQQARATQSRLADALVSAAPRPPAC